MHDTVLKALKMEEVGVEGAQKRRSLRQPGVRMVKESFPGSKAGVTLEGFEGESLGKWNFHRGESMYASFEERENVKPQSTSWKAEVWGSRMRKKETGELDRAGLKNGESWLSKKRTSRTRR